MGGARLGATHFCRVLVQRWRLSASRFFYSVFRLLRLGRSVELFLLFTGQYICQDEARFCTPHGCECDLLLVLGLDYQLAL